MFIRPMISVFDLVMPIQKKGKKINERIYWESNGKRDQAQPWFFDRTVIV